MCVFLTGPHALPVRIVFACEQIHPDASGGLDVWTDTLLQNPNDRELDQILLVYPHRYPSVTAEGIAADAADETASLTEGVQCRANLLYLKAGSIIHNAASRRPPRRPASQVCIPRNLMLHCALRRRVPSAQRPLGRTSPWWPALTRQGVLLVVSGPSGVGKGTIIRGLMSRRPDLRKSVSCTTRNPRPGEQPGVDYHFVSPADFARMRAHGELLEWAVVHQDLCYGTPRLPVEEALARGQDIILEIDYQGARSVRLALGGRAALVFVAPPLVARTARAPGGARDRGAGGCAQAPAHRPPRVLAHGPVPVRAGE